MKVAITGGIGSGKSFVCQRLKRHGINVYDCDTAAKRIIATSPTIKRQLTELIGQNTYIDDKLNKAAVANFLLASADNAKSINGIVHPAVVDDYINSGIDWMECAILFESGFDRLVDKVVAVVAPIDVRINRIMARDNISREKAMEWIGRQMNQEELAKRADFTIVNDGIADIDIQIENILEKIANKTR